MNDSVSITPNDPPVSDDRFWAVAVIKNGKIAMLVEGYPPPKEDNPSDIPLTKSEFYFLRSLPHQWMDMRKLRTMAGRIQNKINKVKK